MLASKTHAIIKQQPADLLINFNRGCEGDALRAHKVEPQQLWGQDTPEGELFSATIWNNMIRAKLGLGIRAGMLLKWDEFHTEETAFERILYEGEIDTCWRTKAKN